jgi:ketosteroid isomerase-like protein
MPDETTDGPILAREAELREAMLTNDVAALDRLIDDALMFVALDGTVVGKEDDLAAHRARRLRLHSLEPSDRHVQRHGPIAVVTVRMALDGTWDGAPASGVYRYTRVWCERPDGWRIVAGHLSAVPS